MQRKICKLVHNLTTCLLCQVPGGCVTYFANVQVRKALCKIECESVRVSDCPSFLSLVHQFSKMCKTTSHFFTIVFALAFDVFIFVLNTYKILHFKVCAYAHSKCENAKIVRKFGCKVTVSFDIPITNLGSDYGFIIE